MKYFKYVFKATSLVLILSLLSGCSYKGYRQLSHNGKYYWFNSDEECPLYFYNTNSPDTVYCADRNKNRNGLVKHPATTEEVAQYMHEQQQSQQFWQGLNDFLKGFNAGLQQHNQNMQQLNNNNVQYFQSMPQPLLPYPLFPYQQNNSQQIYNEMRKMNKGIQQLNDRFDPYNPYSIY